MGEIDSITGVMEGVGPGQTIVIGLLTSVLPEKKNVHVPTHNMQRVHDKNYFAKPSYPSIAKLMFY